MQYLALFLSWHQDSLEDKSCFRILTTALPTQFTVSLIIVIMTLSQETCLQASQSLASQLTRLWNVCWG